jgi:inorganic triphosphatase YgiF
MGEETELKFVGPEEALARLRRSPMLRKLGGRRRPPTLALKAVYYDTDRWALREAGYVLRVRREGKRFEQTIKGVNAASVATRLEVNVPVPAQAPDIQAIPDAALKRRLSRLIGGDELKPVFSIEMQRTKLLLVSRRETMLEAAFDTGVIRSGKARAPISEFELELVKGEPDALIASARELTGGLPLTISLQSKSERGYALAARMANAPLTAGRVTMPPDASASEAFARILAHCVSHFLGNWGAVTVAHDPEGIHQMRVALRRLRSALSLFGGAFRASMQGLESEVRWIARVLGAARDLDVFQDEVLRPVMDAHAADRRLTVLAAFVTQRRRAAWTDVHSALASERFRRLAFDFVAATIHRPWAGKAADEPAPEFARARLAQRHRKALKAGRRIGSLDEAKRHALRIRLKKLRYACDFFQALWPKRAPVRFLKRLGALQDVLGAMNDVAAARALLGEILGQHGNGAEGEALAYAGGVVVDWHVEHARSRARALKRRWQRFAKVRPLWTLWH